MLKFLHLPNLAAQAALVDVPVLQPRLAPLPSTRFLRWLTTPKVAAACMASSFCLAMFKGCAFETGGPSVNNGPPACWEYKKLVAASRFGGICVVSLCRPQPGWCGRSGLPAGVRPEARDCAEVQRADARGRGPPWPLPHRQGGMTPAPPLAYRCGGTSCLRPGCATIRCTRIC